MPDPRHTLRWRQVRRTVLRESNGYCYLCGRPLDFSVCRGDLRPVVDHVHPIDKGGDPYDYSNLEAVHEICNRIKGNRLISDISMKREIDAAKTMDDDFTQSGIDWSL